MSRFPAFLFVLSLMMGAVGCGTPHTTETSVPSVRSAVTSSTEQVTMEIQDYKFLPAQIVAAPGQRIHLNVTNKGKEEHGMDFDLPDGEVSMPSHLKAGESAQFDLKAPKTPSTYHFHCPMGNHYAMGMDGDLIVR